MKPRKTHGNRLHGSPSPYLEQHADNPVDWYPWGPEAFERAAREDKPIFLSIGYSTCHWCHVMAHESFEDEAVADLLNRHFIAIKVDREERPDVDATYMTVCQMMTGRGGWPLTIVMTPERRPFYAATYIPKDTRYGHPGLLQLLPALADAWQRRRDDLHRTAADVVRHLEHAARPAPTTNPTEAAIQRAVETLASQFDERHGGFGSAPKFPSPHQLIFLLRAGWRSDHDAARRMATSTLQAMRNGGIFDHVGGGFHRYSVDARWHVPHFEKMLYDQSMHALAYLEAYHATRNEAHANTARRILDYTLTDLHHPQGAFYSSEDADSEGKEGTFYVWTLDEIRHELGDSAQLFADAFDVRSDGNFAEESTGRTSGHNVLHRTRTAQELAAKHATDAAQVETMLADALQRLDRARRRRPRPHRDEKILTDWNGLHLQALARAGRLLREPRYTQAAEAAADFILDKLRAPDGSLTHRWRNGDAGVPAMADDYAFLIAGLLELYATTHQAAWVERALQLQQEFDARFWDANDAGYWSTGTDQDPILVRSKDATDGAMPSANSVAANNLVTLARLTADPAFEDRASKLLGAFGALIDRAPAAFTYLLTALDYALGPSHEIVLVDPTGRPHAMLDIVDTTYLPRSVTLESSPGYDATAFAPYVRDMRPIGDKTTAYVCQDHACQAPTTDPTQLRRQLHEAQAAKESGPPPRPSPTR